MRIPFRRYAYAGLICLLSGCAIWQAPSGSLTGPAGESSNQPPPPMELKLASFPQVIYVEDLRVGDYCEMRIPSASANPGPNQTADVTKLAGKVVAVNESSVTLIDVISIDDRVTRHTPASPFSKIPYLSRLYKNTGVLVSPVQIPGELAVPRSTISDVMKIDPNVWPQFQQSGFQRIGVDFSFNIPTH